MVLSLEGCSHRLGGDGSLIGGLFPQAGCMVMVLSLEGCSHRKSITNTLQEKNSKQHSFMCTRYTWGCFAAFSISLITGLLYGNAEHNFWTFISLVSQFTNLPHTIVSTLLFPSTILKQQWHFEVDRGFKFCESSFVGIWKL